MFGLSFLNAAFLVGLVAAAVPVIIHLLNRRRVRRVKFSSLEFLDEVNKQRMRRLNLRRILILILRTLAVLFIVVAFARPTLRTGLLFSGSVPKNVIVCLDASYSMGAVLETETGTAFDAAKRAARQIVDAAEANDAINAVVFSDRAEPLLERGTRNKGVVKTAIDGVTLTAEKTSIRAAVDRALELVEASDVEGGEVYVVSDFRYGGDSTLVDESRLPADVRLYFIPVYDEEVDNASIDRIGVPRKLMRPGEVVRVSVTVSNHSRRTPASVPLELAVEGDRRAEQVVEIAPSASQTVAFPVSFDTWGRYHCRVSKNPDRLSLDDDRYFLLEVSKSVPVTVVTGRRHAAGAGTAAPGVFYVEKALNPRGTPEGEFTVRVIDERDVTTAALPSGGVVVWVDAKSIEPKRMGLIERYVRRGGGLVVFLGGAERSLLDDASFRALLGMRGAAEKSGEPQTAFMSFEKGHAVFSIFTKEELELLSRAKVSKLIAARGVFPDSVLAYTGGGDPALWECTRGRGRVLVFAAAPELEHGDLPLSPMFLPLVHTSVSYLASEAGSPRSEENLVGEPLYFELAQIPADETQLVVRDPAGEMIQPVVAETPLGDARVGCERPARVGFYRLYRDTTLVNEAVINADARESNLAVGSLPEDRPEGVSIVRAGGDFQRNLHAAREGREVFGLFIVLAIAALAAETVLGRKG